MKIYLVAGVPGSGKSWVCEQLRDQFTYVRHDDYIKKGDDYAGAIVKAAKTSERPLLIEAPFSVSDIVSKLFSAGHRATPVYIVEDPSKLAKRYMERDGKTIPTGHLTRMRTYADRAKEQKAFSGTSDQVLAHLREIAGVKEAG